MKRSQLLTVIIIAIQAIFLVMSGYSLESPVFWIALAIVMIDYYHSHREWSLEQCWVGFGVQMIPIVLWAILIWYFDIKMSAFFVVMISGVVASFYGLHLKSTKRKEK